ncbi:hypothetical protein LWC34_42985 [Kibdelosporangium philippinense]|uniref:Uncharacterized protein n=1 Tax=Kibdelosporangium philippinense TaxID=211113 RepID=A0ABS8ZP41_9PSEU|nr:hypothetical protein [Kibdelosporangium philippinense]MCE7009529.1 hypothetical protein [Kibdelosporangium philippinense]
MSRTAHHRTGPWPGGWRPWRIATARGFRYSAACLAEAYDRRPWPQAIRREVSFYRYPRALPRDTEVARLSAITERRARQRLRGELTDIRRRVNRLSKDRLKPGDVDVTPFAHHHEAIHHSW